MARYLKSFLYIHWLHLSPFINHLKISLKVMLKKIKPFYSTKSVIVKGFRLARAPQKCITVLFYRKKKVRTITKI